MGTQADYMERAEKILKEYFGYDRFHSGQYAVIEQLLTGRDVLGIMPTGAGKSVCYQIPALLLPGVTVILSPLISLMKDQVDGLRRMGIPAALINSTLSPREMDETLYALQCGEIKLLYIAPERLEAEGFLPLIQGLDVSLVAVDEAHCVSQWGHDFRPSYRRIRELIGALPSRPLVGAFTATATEVVREDILKLLELREPYVLTTGFDRPNLYFAAHAPADRDAYILDYLRENRGNPGIIYCLTRKQVDKLAALLRSREVAALGYHAGMPDEERRRNQEAFRDDEADVIVATNAFGMGIDKSNVRFVIHYGMPRTVENYYQEAGRAGRDGERADCILLYGAQDVVTNRFLIENSSDAADKKAEYKKLQDMIDYCNGDSCLRGYILRYFGMEDLPENCGNCLSCRDEGERTDITVEAQKILSCVKRMGNRFGSGLVSQVLRGADTKKLRELGFLELSTYGIMGDYSDKTIKELISYLVARGILEVSEGEYPVLAAGTRAMRFLRDRESLSIKRAVAQRGRRGRDSHMEHAPLYEALRTLRRDIARELEVPPYQVFTDATLKDMCDVLPRSREDMRQVSGVGSYKLEQYGEEFLFTIREYMDERGLESPPPRQSSPQARERTVGDTAFVSYALYEQGRSLEEIAAERGIAQQTVEKHLLDAARTGKKIDYEAFIAPEHRDAIFAAIDEAGIERLRPIKELLPEEVSYTSIRFAVELYKSRSKT